jgi:hypothetical protein
MRRQQHLGIVSVLQNPLVTNAILGGYAHNEALAIRRLVDRPWSGDRAVCSLPSVIDLMKRERGYVTRETFVSRDGVPYDPAPHRRAYEASIDRLLNAALAASVGQMKAINCPAPAAFGLPDFRRSESRHEAFDWLSGTAPAQRRPDDVISCNTLDCLAAELEPERSQQDGPIRTLLRVADKFAAHAATRASRDAAGETGAPIPFHVIVAAHCKITAVGGALSDVLCDALHPIVPLPQGTELAYLLDPRLPDHEATRLRGLWDALPRWYSRRVHSAKRDLMRRLQVASP